MILKSNQLPDVKKGIAKINNLNFSSPHPLPLKAKLITWVYRSSMEDVAVSYNARLYHSKLS